MKYFINISNHPSERWSDKQKSTAERYGEIVDLSFPPISPYADSDEIDRLVSEYCGKTEEHDCAAVMVQGEFVFTYRLVGRLKEKGITVLSACSERRAAEHTDESGNTVKTSEFVFVGFREY
ncbi:MAG: hypothetical protein K6B74_13495 [Ruminococcus sp.]|nr:hypothetical protein [Ruminococcus sp.]